MQRLKILIVDDDPDMAGFIKLKLSSDAPHFSIIQVESGQDCLDLIDGGEAVDCILSDYQLPGMNGMELLMELRARGSRIPLIFITGQGNEGVAREAFKAGAYDYFTKDIGFAHFTRIRNSIEQAVKNRESEDDREKAEALLVEEKNKLESVLACMSDGIGIVDTDFRILYQNPAHKGITGGAYAGAYCYEAYHGRDAICENCQVAMAFADGISHTVERVVVTDAGPRYYEVSASPLKDSSGRTVGCVESVRDVTSRKLDERKVEHLNRLYSIISHTNKAILRTTDRTKLMEEACRIAVEQGRFRMAWVGLADRAGGVVRPVASWGAVEGYLDEIRVSSVDEPEGRGPVGRAIREGAPFVVNDIGSDPAMALWREKALARGYRSLAGFPIKTGEGVIGAFAVYSAEPGMFDDEETALMEGLAADISFALTSLEKDERRHLAEEAMRESEQKVTTIADTVMDAIVMIDKDGRISYWNPAAERTFGYSADEVMGRDLHELVLPERYWESFNRQKVDFGMTGSVPTGRQAREFSAVGKDGREFPVEVSLSSVKIKGEWNFVGVVRDITERKRAEAMLRESEQRYKDLVELSPDFIYRSDRYGNQTFMNAAAYRMLDASPEDVVGQPWGKWIHPEDMERTRRCFMEMIERGIDAFNFENRFVSKNGRSINVLHNVRVLRDEEGVITGTQGIARDITARKAAEEALKESEHLFRSLVEESLVGVYIIQDGRFSYVNPRAAGMFGYTQEEVLAGIDVKKAIHPDDLGVIEDAIRKTFSGELRNVVVQFKGVKKDGGVIEVETLAAVTSYNGRPALIGTALDITDRKRSEEEKNAMFHMLTHDIKGPLSVIYGYCDMVRQSAGLDAGEMADEMQKAAKRISALIDDMLALSRFESKEAVLDKAPVSVAYLLRQAMRDYESFAAEKGISMEMETDPALPNVLADSAQLTRVFSNLVSNAVHYNKKGGKVSLKVRRHGDGDSVAVEVKDDGEGIAQEDMPHIFDKYYRGKRMNKKYGTGLGLAIVKAAVDAHGGSVSAESVRGKGSTFTVVLPAIR
jgi:PAS domain S-box-containing protein